MQENYQNKKYKLRGRVSKVSIKVYTLAMESEKI